MNDWLSEIEENLEEDLNEFRKRPHNHTLWTVDNDAMVRMARVLRELAGVIIKYRQAEGKALCEIFMSDCSDDAKELCVAARDESNNEIGSE